MVEVNNIPSILKEMPNWVNWKLKERKNKDGTLAKPAKIPINPKTKRVAKTNDANTWGNFNTALANSSKIGFVLTDEVVGIDVDLPIDDETCQKIISYFSNTYCEQSPNGYLHILCSGKIPCGYKPGKANLNKRIEVYDKTSSRYFTVTGDKLKNAPSVIANCQEGLDWLLATYFKPTLNGNSSDFSDKPVDDTTPTPKNASKPITERFSLSDNEILEKCEHAKNASKFEALFSGGGHDDESSGDLALASMLAFYTKDAFQLDRLMRMSGRNNLKNGKWDEKHYSDGSTYGQKTLEKALSGNQQSYSPPTQNMTTDNSNIFWYAHQNDSGKLNIGIDYTRMYEFINSLGYMQIYINQPNTTPDWILVKSINNVLEFATLAQLKHICFNQINESNYEHKEAIKEMFIKGINVYIERGKLDTVIPPQTVNFVTDDRDCLRFFYRNGFLEIKEDSIVLKPYSELNGYLWKSQILQRDFQLESIKDFIDMSDFSTFCQDVCTVRNTGEIDKQRFHALRWHLGYMLHQYTCGMNRAVIFTEANINTDTSEGRTGKGLLMQAISKLRNLVILDGKAFKPEERFAWQRVELSTQNVFIDDIRYLHFESLFSILSEGMQVEKKNQSAFYMPSPKMTISTNRSITDTSGSAKARMTEMELLCYYSNEYKPVDKYHHQFFHDWDNEQWHLFDNFMTECVQLYLKAQRKCAYTTEPPDYHSESIELRKLIFSTSEAFVEYMITILDESFKNNGLFESEAKTVYENFLEYASLDKKEITFTKFGKWIPKYCNFNNLSFSKETPKNAETGGKTKLFYKIKRT